MGSAFPVLRENVEAADWLHLTEGETIRWTGRPSRFTIAFSVLGGIVLAVVGVALTAWIRLGAVDVPWVGYLPLALAVVGIGWAGATYLDWVRLLYVITDDVVYVKYGLVSRDVTQIRLDRVQNTSFEQSVHQRLLRYGDVCIYTAGTGTEDLTLRSVPNPERVSQLLTELLSDGADAPDDAVRYRDEGADGEYVDGA